MSPQIPGTCGVTGCERTLFRAFRQPVKFFNQSQIRGQKLVPSQPRWFFPFKFLVLHGPRFSLSQRTFEELEPAGRLAFIMDPHGLVGLKAARFYIELLFELP